MLTMYMELLKCPENVCDYLFFYSKYQHTSAQNKWHIFMAYLLKETGKVPGCWPPSCLCRISQTCSMYTPYIETQPDCIYHCKPTLPILHCCLCYQTGWHQRLGQEEIEEVPKILWLSYKCCIIQTNRYFNCK